MSNETEWRTEYLCRPWHDWQPQVGGLCLYRLYKGSNLWSEARILNQMPNSSYYRIGYRDAMGKERIGIVSIERLERIKQTEIG